jgi:hypothetical protein
VATGDWLGVERRGRLFGQRVIVYASTFTGGAARFVAEMRSAIL